MAAAELALGCAAAALGGDALVRSRAVPLPRLLEVAAVGDAELRARFVSDGFVKLDGAFPQALAARLARAAFDDGGGASYYRSMPTTVDLPTDGSSESL